MGHIQTETPYYQPVADHIILAYIPGQGNFIDDPTFDDCSSDNYIASWAFSILNSTNIFVYPAGLCSFFQGFQLGCGNQ